MENASIWPTWPNGMKKHAAEMTQGEWDAQFAAAKRRINARQQRADCVLASKQVSNGRWRDHTVKVCIKDGRFLYCNGWSDPLECSEEDAWRYFHERTTLATA